MEMWKETKKENNNQTVLKYQKTFVLLLSSASRNITWVILCKQATSYMAFVIRT